MRPVYEAGDIGLFVGASTGSGWRLQPSLFAASIVGSAASRVMFTGGDTNDLELLVATTEETLEEIRALLLGDVVTASVVTGLDGITIEDSSEVESPWGVLRSASAPMAESRSPWRDPFGAPVTTAIVETPVDVTYKLGEPAATERCTLSCSRWSALEELRDHP